MFMPGPAPSPAALTRPWHLPPQGLVVFHGECDAPRLSHYFLPRLVREGKRILFLDGANCVNPRLMARLAEQRGIPFAQFNRQIMLARAFTCFQLTELIRRAPQFLAEFPAQVLMVTAFPELYFDEDIRHADAHATFHQALGRLRGWAAQARESLTVALFSSVSAFQPPASRKSFFAETCAAATELWKFQVDGEGRLGLMRQDKGLGSGDWVLGARGWGLGALT